MKYQSFSVFDFVLGVLPFTCVDFVRFSPLFFEVFAAYEYGACVVLFDLLFLYLDLDLFLVTGV